MLPHNDPLQRNVYGKSTATSLHFAATMAMAARLFKDYDADWAQDCQQRAVLAWDWAVENDDAIFENPEGVLSGAYSNNDMSDEFLWAAAELYTTTFGIEYLKYIIDHRQELLEMEAPGWANVVGMAITSLAVQDTDLPKELRSLINQSLLQWADNLISGMNASAYRVPEYKMVWGSNGFIGSTGLCFVYAYKVSNDEKYLKAAAEVADYILGKNATGYCFVTRFGSQTVKNLHHSVSIADGIPGSLPGFVPGGPNPSMEDALTSEHGEGARYASPLPAKAYIDDVRSYASNENDICYSSPVLSLLAALDYYYGVPNNSDWSAYYKIPKNFDQN